MEEGQVSNCNNDTNSNNCMFTEHLLSAWYCSNHFKCVLTHLILTMLHEGVTLNISILLKNGWNFIRERASRQQRRSKHVKLFLLN